MKKLNWGIIGSGVIANEMAQALLDVNGEIYAVGHRDMNKAIDFAMKYKIKNAYGSVEELLNDPDVDVVYIATPHNSHYEIMKQAVAVKKHVLCEKAITVNDRQLEEIVALAKKNNVVVQEVVMALTMRAKQPKRGVISGELGYIEINNYPRSNQATITYTKDGHQEVIECGDDKQGLQYEVIDMQDYIINNLGEYELQLTRDVSSLLSQIRTQWGMIYPFE